MQAFSHSLREVLDRLNDANSEKKSIDEECQKQITEKTKLELAVKDLDRTVKDDRTLKVISWGSTGSYTIFFLTQHIQSNFNAWSPHISHHWSKNHNFPSQITTVGTSRKLPPPLHVLISTCTFVECLTLLRVRMWITVIHICSLSSVNIIVLPTWSFTYRRASSSSVVRASKLELEGSVVSSILTCSSEIFSELSVIRILVFPNYIVTKKFHAMDSLQIFRFVQTSSQKRPSLDQLLWSKSVASLWDGVILFLLDFVINSFTHLSEWQRTWWQIGLKIKAYRFTEVTISCSVWVSHCTVRIEAVK